MPDTAKIHFTGEWRDEHDRRARSRSLAVRGVERAKIIPGLAAGKAKKEIAGQAGIARQTVRRWEQRFSRQGIKGLEEAPRPGRPGEIKPDTIEQIVRKTTRDTPPAPHIGVR